MRRTNVVNGRKRARPRDDGEVTVLGCIADRPKIGFSSNLRLDLLVHAILSSFAL